jgi:hypothetical protein
VPRLAQHESGIGRLGNRAAVAKNNNVGTYVQRRLCNRVDPPNADFKRWSSLCADGAARCQAHVCDQEVRPRSCHGFGLLRLEHIRRGQEIFFVRQLDHRDFQAVTHAGLFQVLAKSPVDQSNGRKILHSRKTNRGDLLQKDIELAERIRAIDSREHRCFLDDWQNLVRHFHHNMVGVAACEQT